MLTVRKATKEDAISLAPRLREIDKRELVISTGSTDIESILTEGIEISSACFVAVDSDDIPHIIFGVSPTSVSFTGCVWMVGTEAIKENWRQLLRETRQWVERLSTNYKLLINSVYVKNPIHLRWLKWAGFTFIKVFYVKGEPFAEFVLIKHEDETNV